VERIYSVVQMNRLLKSFGLSYTDLIEGRAEPLFKETTNGFCYYVLTPLLLHYYDQTMGWFINNNETLIQFSKETKQIYLFYHYIKTIYNRKEWIEFTKKLSETDVGNVSMAAFDVML
jgi:hypothetical protein